MLDEDRSTPLVPETTARSGFPLMAGALLVAVIVGAYILLGTPGLHTQVAKAPVGQPVDVTIEQQPGTAPPAPSNSPAPASGR